MKNFTILAATTKEATNPFTVANLESLAKTCKHVPILSDFDQTRYAGMVTSGKVESSELIITGWLLDEINPVGLFLVPGFTVETHRCYVFSLVRTPMDNTLTPFAAGWEHPFSAEKTDR